MIDGVGEVADRLASAADTLSDLALDRLRRAAEAARDGDPSDAATEGSPASAEERARLLAEEKVLTRARRAVEKAVHLLAPPAGGDPGP